ncbi:sulfate adenylyltransferase OS=Streptomyces fumanus OX=67302 GN=GCM10018772_38910 PE=4 SV=1 [Streptomyces fumanus]
MATVDTLRFATAGSVDDGKSTLVGRLLHDSKSVLADQLEAVRRASRGEGPDLALLTDGLRAEREQGITIDVAYRYFATPRRRFILADTPGHVQYTRNMVTGASTAELTVVLVDARNGVVEQTRRHAAIAALLRVPHVVLAVNKMDLVGYQEGVFEEIAAEFAKYAIELGVPEVTAVPVSAVSPVTTSSSPPPAWTGTAGPPSWSTLETVPVAAGPADAPARFPVQYVIRHGERRYYAGQVASGVLRVGDRVTVHPSGEVSEIAGIDVLGTPAGAAHASQSVSLRLTDQRDIARGDLITAGVDAPSAHPGRPRRRLPSRRPAAGDRGPGAAAARHPHGTGGGPGPRRRGPPGRQRPRPDRPAHRRAAAAGRLRGLRRTGAFLLIDPADGATLTAGMVALAAPV